MMGAMAEVARIVAEWCDAHQDSFPPTILHVTDGQSNDGSPEENAATVRSMTTRDGNALLYNLHVSGPGREILFPTSERELPDEYGRMLFRMSSPVPPTVAANARGKGYNVTDESRGMIYNASAEFIVDFFQIGTTPLLRMITAR
jgi:hypothetical protein